MFNKLRRKFIVITLALVGIVLAGTLASLVFSTWVNGRNQIDFELDRALTMSGNTAPAIGLGSPEGSEDGGHDYTHTPILVINVTGGVDTYDASTSFVSISDSALEEVLEAVEASGADSGVVVGQHIAWQRCVASDGSYRLAMADTSELESNLVEQIAGSVAILCAALVVMFFIARALAIWALRPVEQSWEQQKRFVADASHELKTPLTVILANSEILQANEKNLDEESRKWVDSTIDEARRMKMLVNELLELARTDNDLEAGAGTDTALAKQDVDLTALVDKVTLQFDAVAFERGCMIDTNIAKDIHVQGTAPQLERLITILIDNACKYAPSDSAISVRLSREAGRVHLDVNNAGDPIDPKDLPHVFERFYRSDTVRTKSEAGGYGLGLAIAQGIAEVHHGHISVRSNAADGTTFSLVL